MKYKKFLNDYYNMKSNITLADYLGCRELMSVVDVYTIDEETSEDFLGALGREDLDDLSDTEKAYKVVKINDNSIVVYIGSGE